jgi:hypothetical protein
MTTNPRDGVFGTPERSPHIMDLHTKLALVQARTEAVADDVKEIRVSLDKLAARDGEMERALANHAIVTERAINGIADRFGTMLKEVTERFSEKIVSLHHDAFKRSDMTWIKTTATALLAAGLAASIGWFASHSGQGHIPVEIVTHP